MVYRKITKNEKYSDWLKFIGSGYKYVGNYEIGPWMILHVLSCPQNRNRLLEIDLVLLKLKNEENFDKIDQLILLEKVLEIDNFTFLKHLTVPGLDGHPFISPNQ